MSKQTFRDFYRTQSPDSIWQIKSHNYEGTAKAILENPDLQIFLDTEYDSILWALDPSKKKDA
jgi:hypothetical protein